jgi:transposase
MLYTVFMRRGLAPDAKPANQEKDMATSSNAPTQKQISYILSLCGGRYDSDAYREIAKTCGISTSSAQRRATKADASKTIDRLQAA